MSEAMGQQKKRLAIIDGKSVFYRGYYAMPNLVTKDGTPTGGVFGFATMALEVIRRLKPDYVAVAWDKPKTNIRKRLALYPQYKSGRKSPPPDFHEQIPILHELLEAFGWPLYELDDYEADDIMGTLALQAAKKDIEVMLVTSDLDMLQLIDPHVHVFALKKGLSNIELYNPKSFEEKYHLSPDQFLDLKALKGDASDNIPGVPGVGEKTAIQLLQEFKTLENVYANLWQVKDSVRRKLERGKDLAFLSKQLGAIWIDAPLELDLSSMDGSKADPTAVQPLLKRLEFKSLSTQLPAAISQVIDKEQRQKRNNFVRPKIVHVNSAADLLRFSNRQTKRVVVHSYAAKKHGKDPQFFFLSPSPKEVYVFDVTALGRKRVKDAIEPMLDSDQIEKIGYDIKSSIKTAYALGCTFVHVGHDVRIGAFLLDALRREQTLTELAEDDLGFVGASFENLPPEDIVLQIQDLVAVIWKLYDLQVSALNEFPKIRTLAATIEWPVIPVLARMEYEGIELDTAYMGTLSEEFTKRLQTYEQNIYALAGHEFNIGSPSQLADVLFKELRLSTQGIKKGKTGYSTAASELEKLKDTHQIIRLITEWREVAKLKNTYVDVMPSMVDERSRLHTTFNLTITQTGRLSSTDPNLQNIPVRSELGKRIRQAFVAGKGKSFVSADYSQFELRLAAVLAEDDELIALFNEGADIHTMIAAQVHGCAPEAVTKDMRRAAKVINFGILYGMSPHGLSVAADMTRDQAQAFIDRYKELRRPLFIYMDKTRELARQKGYVETLFGRRRPMPDIHSSNYAIRQAAERAAINMPIQGTEADLMKMAMIAVQHKLPRDAKMLLQIHDSILIECSERDASSVATLLREEMEHVYSLPVKLAVDVTVGHHWGEL